MSIINCPLKEKSIAVSKTVRPVTVQELTDVNKASFNPILVPELATSGIINNKVPTIIKLEKDIINRRGGDIGFLFISESLDLIILDNESKKNKIV